MHRPKDREGVVAESRHSLIEALINGLETHHRGEQISGQATSFDLVRSSHLRTIKIVMNHDQPCERDMEQSHMLPAVHKSPDSAHGCGNSSSEILSR